MYNFFISSLSITRFTLSFYFCQLLYLSLLLHRCLFSFIIPVNTTNYTLQYILLQPLQLFALVPFFIYLILIIYYFSVVQFSHSLLDLPPSFTSSLFLCLFLYLYLLPQVHFIYIAINYTVIPYSSLSSLSAHLLFTLYTF